MSKRPTSFVSSNADWLALFECEGEGDIGVNGGDRSRLCGFFLLCAVPTDLFDTWLEALDPSGSNWDVIIKLNSRLVLNVL